MVKNHFELEYKNNMNNGMAGVVENLNIWAYYREDDVIWCLVQQDAFLYKINCHKNIMEQVAPLLDEVYQKMAFSAIIPYRNSYIFIPGSADSVVMFEPGSCVRQSWKIPVEEKKIGSSGIKFFNGLIHEDCLYMFGYSFPGILKMDLKSKAFHNINGWLEKKEDQFTDKSDGCFHMRYYRKENMVYYPFMNKNAVLIFNLGTEAVCIRKVGDSIQRYTSIEYGGNGFWLFPRDGSTGSIVRWMPDVGSERYYRCYPEEFDYSKYAFCATEKLGEKIFLFAHAGNINISFNTVTGEMNTFDELYDTSDVKTSKYVYTDKSGDYIFILTDHCYIWWEPIGGGIRQVPFKLSDDIIQRFRKKREEEKMQELQRVFGKYKGECIVKENEKVNLESLVMYMAKG